MTTLRKLLPIFLGELLKQDDVLKKVLHEHLNSEPSSEVGNPEEEQSCIIEDDSSAESLLGRHPGAPIEQVVYECMEDYNRRKRIKPKPQQRKPELPVA